MPVQSLNTTSEVKARAASEWHTWNAQRVHYVSWSMRLVWCNVVSPRLTKQFLNEVVWCYLHFAAVAKFLDEYKGGTCSEFIVNITCDNDSVTLVHHWRWQLHPQRVMTANQRTCQHVVHNPQQTTSMFDMCNVWDIALVDASLALNRSIQLSDMKCWHEASGVRCISNCVLVGFL